MHHCEIVGGALVGSASFRYRITDAGRTRAALFLDQNGYVGVAPVPIVHYQEYMGRFRGATPRTATPDRVREAFSELVLSDRVLDQLGPAINAQRSMFIYGPSGNGKSLMTQRIRELLDGDIAIPYALEIEGQIVRVFDPVLHEELPLADQSDGIDNGPRLDRRWVRCRRPLVTVGGELTLDALDLAYGRNSGFYRAPVQVAANGGVLVIDDFGRQKCSPQELLNRWIGPLETRVDYLVLQSGQRIEVPFQVLVVFATNIRPGELVDEAFLRRIHFKIFAESPTVTDYLHIFERYCEDLRRRLRSGSGGGRVAVLLSPATTAAARLPSARPDRPGAVDGRLPRSAARADEGAAARRVLSPTSWTTESRSPSTCDGHAPSQARAGHRRGSRRDCSAGHRRLQDRRADQSLTVRITSPMGRTGSFGAVRVVAQVSGAAEPLTPPPVVKFFVDGTSIGEDTDGPPFAVEWVDENPFERREISVSVTDNRNREAADRVVLEPFEITEVSEVSSVLLEATVEDAKGRRVTTLDAEGILAVGERRAPESRHGPRATCCRRPTCCSSTAVRACLDASTS